MKKALLSITVFAAALLVACSGGDKVPGKLPKEGLAPFENSKHLEYLRDTLRVPSDVPVISFNARYVEAVCVANHTFGKGRFAGACST